MTGKIPAVLKNTDFMGRDSLIGTYLWHKHFFLLWKCNVNTQKMNDNSEAIRGRLGLYSKVFF